MAVLLVAKRDRWVSILSISSLPGRRLAVYDLPVAGASVAAPLAGFTEHFRASLRVRLANLVHPVAVLETSRRFCSMKVDSPIIRLRLFVGPGPGTGGDRDSLTCSYRGMGYGGMGRPGMSHRDFPENFADSDELIG